jgi:hypothetical protein
MCQLRNRVGKNKGQRYCAWRRRDRGHTHNTPIADSAFAKPMRARTPLGRVGRPDNIVCVAVFLASDDSMKTMLAAVIGQPQHVALSRTCVERGVWDPWPGRADRLAVARRHGTSAVLWCLPSEI